MNSLSAPQRPMRVMDSIHAAIERSRDMLFRPFDAKKWLFLGVIIFIEALGSGGGGSGGGNGGGMRDGSGFRPSEAIRSAESWFLDHLVIILAIALPVFLVLLVLGLALVYLGSRGQLMFVRAVVKDDAGIGANWRASGPRTVSLFLFNALFGLGFGLLCLLIMALGYWSVHTHAVAGVDDLWAYLLVLIPCLVVLMGIFFIFTVIRCFVRNFVVPIIYWRDVPCMQAIGEFGGLMRGNLPALILFLGAKVIYSVIFMIVSMLLGCLTCCIGFLPVLHHALFAPYYVFDRAFSLYMLQSAWPEAFQVEERVPPPPPSEPPPLADVVLPAQE